jgi:hypothetical protein
MAFLRRGLVTNKGVVPSIHTRSALKSLAELDEQPADEAQPSIIIKAVKRIIKMGETIKDYHLVELACGHTAKSKSTFQGYCTKCK